MSGCQAREYIHISAPGDLRGSAVPMQLDCPARPRGPSVQRGTSRDGQTCSGLRQTTLVVRSKCSVVPALPYNQSIEYSFNRPYHLGYTQPVCKHSEEYLHTPLSSNTDKLSLVKYT